MATIAPAAWVVLMGEMTETCAVNLMSYALAGGNHSSVLSAG